MIYRFRGSGIDQSVSFSFFPYHRFAIEGGQVLIHRNSCVSAICQIGIGFTLNFQEFLYTVNTISVAVFQLQCI